MTGFGTNSIGDGAAQAVFTVGSALTSNLMTILNATEIVPGSQPSYELCKAIYAEHPLGGKMVDVPIALALSQPREITIPVGPETRLIEAFQGVSQKLGGRGAEKLTANVTSSKRIYGISSLVVGARGHNPKKPLPREKLHQLDLYFNVLDPLTTAGSLVLNQDPNSPEFQRPQAVAVGSQVYHPANSIVVMNEDPIYIYYANSAFGFVGRSVYQRALYPLKSFIQTLITDDMVAFKAGVMVAKMISQTSNTNRRVWDMFGFKRSAVKTATTGQVISIAPEESIESINLQMLEKPYQLARDNILKNVASAASMPARLLDQETMVSGFGEGQEDAKNIARYVDGLRHEIDGTFSFLDDIVQRIAWNPDFYADLQKDYPEYRKVPYETAFHEWRNAFTPQWPNLLVEPESELMLVEDIRFKAVIGLIETLSPILDKKNREELILWVSDEINTREKLFKTQFMIDPESLHEMPDAVQSRWEGKEPEVAPESYQDAVNPELLSTIERFMSTRRFSSTDDSVVALKRILDSRLDSRKDKARVA
ncbi:MAG: anti-CBASS protein Acb1 family protein [Acidobacteriaceae bacterium]